MPSQSTFGLGLVSLKELGWCESLLGFVDGSGGDCGGSFCTFCLSNCVTWISKFFAALPGESEALSCSSEISIAGRDEP